MSDRPTTPLRALVRGVIAGAAGTAVMTAAQTAYYKYYDIEPSDMPGEVGERIVTGVLQREVTPEQRETLDTVMHWAYGTTWGALYGLAGPTVRSDHPVRSGLGFTLLVWGASLVHLPAMQLGPPPWEMPPAQIPPDLGFHAVYGVATAVAHSLLP